MLKRLVQGLIVLAMAFPTIVASAQTEEKDTYVESLFVGSWTRPQIMTMDSNTKQLYVLNSYADTTIDTWTTGGVRGSVSKFDLTTSPATQKTTVLPAIHPRDMAYDSVLKRLYIAMPAANRAGHSNDFITVLDENLNLVSEIKGLPGISSVAVNSSNQRVYTAAPYYKKVSVIDGNNNTVLGSKTFTESVRKVVVDPVSNRVFVFHPDENKISVLNEDLNLITTISTPMLPVNAIVSQTTGKFYVANRPEPRTGKVYVSIYAISGETFTLEETLEIPVSLGGGVNMIVEDPALNRIYFSAGRLVVLDPTTKNFSFPTFHGWGSFGVVVDKNTHRYYSADYSNDSVHVHEPKTLPVALPKIEATSTYIPGTWTNQDVEVTFNSNAAAGIQSIAVTGAVTASGTTSPFTVTVSQEGANQSVTGTVTDKQGEIATTTFDQIFIDKTPPIVTYSGAQPTYTLTQTVNITCSATDELSGVASDTCQTISGPAYMFATGLNTFTTTATDQAGNEGQGGVEFSVVLDAGSLGDLIDQFVSKKGVAESMKAKIKMAENGNTKPFINQVNAQIGKALTAEQADILIRLIQAL